MWLYLGLMCGLGWVLRGSPGRKNGGIGGEEDVTGDGGEAQDAGHGMVRGSRWAWTAELVTPNLPPRWNFRRLPAREARLEGAGVESGERVGFGRVAQVRRRCGGGDTRYGTA